MKFFATLALMALSATAALAQTIDIGYPSNGFSTSPGATFTVEVDRPDSIEGCIEVAIVLALQSCPTGPCPSPSQALGSILYNGPFNPQFQQPGKPAYQNFTVQVPTYVGAGGGLLSLTHLCLLGAGPYPFLEFRNVTLNIM